MKKKTFADIKEAFAERHNTTWAKIKEDFEYGIGISKLYGFEELMDALAEEWKKSDPDSFEEGRQDAITELQKTITFRLNHLLSIRGKTEGITMANEVREAYIEKYQELMDALGNLKVKAITSKMIGSKENKKKPDNFYCWDESCSLERCKEQCAHCKRSVEINK